MATEQNIKIKWVTKFVTERDWREHYSELSYAPIKKVKGGMRIGFLVAEKNMPTDCMEASGDDLKAIRSYRESARIFPLPDIPEYVKPYPE